MPESGDAKLFQVLRRQARKDPFVNLVLAERYLGVRRKWPVRVRLTNRYDANSSSNRLGELLRP